MSIKLKSIHFKNEFGQAKLGLLKLLRSLEGGTRSWQNINWLLLQPQFQPLFMVLYVYCEYANHPINSIQQNVKVGSKIRI